MGFSVGFAFANQDMLRGTTQVHNMLTDIQTEHTGSVPSVSERFSSRGLFVEHPLMSLHLNRQPLASSGCSTSESEVDP